MAAFLAISLLLLLLHFSAAGNQSLTAEEELFFKRCPPSRCGGSGLEVRFPLRLSSASRSCGYDRLDVGLHLNLSCSSQNLTILILSLSSFGLYAVTDIDYLKSRILASPLGSPPPCPFRNLTPSVVGYFDATTLNCSTRHKTNEHTLLAGPISCLSDADHFAYLAGDGISMDMLPSDCVVVSPDSPPNAGPIPPVADNLVDSVEVLDQRRDVNISWTRPYGEVYALKCQQCEATGQVCGYSWLRNETFCIDSLPGPDPTHHRHGPTTALIAGVSIGGLVILILVGFILVHISKESTREKETRMRVERFLATYTSTKPTRYSFTGIKKITKNFKQKLGQGGFGTVYKGELPNGIPVAVKMLEKSKGKGEEFINEVATIGRIHHINVVRLLGFCSEGTRHALVYEFMPNESLEKFISSKQAKGTDRVSLTMDKLQEIAIGIAQGIEYLHQGCDQRILHFDIKPHNILLDHNLNPKISDFGLAKLCSKDNSIVTMTAARGTMGYIAPEIYSRNFGTVSYKSDVYSFGMLLMDMVGGRENLESTIQNQESIYFPEIIYDRLAHGQDLRLTMGVEENQEETAKKLLIVALWCIQWSPVDRPSMSKVVKMLMSDLESLEVPPKPFTSASNLDN